MIRILLAALLTLSALTHSTACGAQAGLPRTVDDVLARLDKTSEPANASAARGILARTLPAGARGDALLDFHLARASAAADLGQTDVVLAERRRIVELTEGDSNQPKHLLDLAIVEMAAGDWSAAQGHAEKAAQASTAYYGQDIAARALLARMQSWLGDVSKARSVTDHIEERFRQARLYSGAAPYVDLVSALVLWAKGDTLAADGQAAQAESALREAVKHGIADTRIAAERAGSIERAPSPDVTWLLLDLMEAQLARFLALQGRLPEAEVVARAMIARNVRRYGGAAASTGVALATLGEVLVGQGRWAEAGRVAERAAGILRTSGTAVHSAYSFAGLKVRADALVGESRWSEAARLVETMRSAFAGQEAVFNAIEHQGAWALAMIHARRAPVAAEWLARLHEEQKRVLGAERYETAETLGLLGTARAAMGEREAALEAFLQAVPVLVAPARAAEHENALRRVKRRAVLLAYVGLLHDLQGSPLVAAKRIDAAAEALRIGDALRPGAAQAALAASAARALAGTPRLGELIRREQDLQREAGLLHDRMNALALAPEARERDDALARARSRAAAIEEERARVLRSIAAQFPDYAELVTPRPGGLEEARKMLRANEALVSVVSGEERTYVWAIGPDRSLAFAASRLGIAEIHAIVERLRSALAPEELRVEALRSLDLRAAHLLYTEILQPVAAAWKTATELSLVTDGSLARLPFAMLPTELPAAPEEPEAKIFDSMRRVPWLARRVSVTNVPSIGVLARLRSVPQGDPGRGPLVGFGDPQFEASKGVPSLAEPGDTPVLRTRSLVRRSVDQADYATLAPLPETRAELQAIAAALGADQERALFLGARASRRNVLATDLSRQKVVAFATHGLVAGELPGLTQPALALAMPGSEGGSPLLTLEDVLGLRLDADLVVLSACNSGGGDGQAAEALTGLGRGFFYAGSRTLLATHWPVETESAKILVSELFARYAKDPALSRAQALRQAMIAVIDSPGQKTISFAHPMFWAGYSLYGDGGR